MASKAPKKKESKDHVALKDNPSAFPQPISEERPSSKRKPPIPIWSEWNDQDILNEKWDTGKKEKERGRSPIATVHYFDDPEGKLDIPLSLQHRVKAWKRPTDLFDENNPVIVSNEHVNENVIDLLTPNEHITDSEFMRYIISSYASLLQVFTSASETDTKCNLLRMKTSSFKEQSTSKADKSRKDVENVDDSCWKPWDLIWPKENAKSNFPAINSAGKYAVKIFWMGCHRKIIVDDSIPCDENMKPLLPLTTRGNELWPIIISKALIKVASLDYYGGQENCEFGDMNIIYCLTGWLPEQIPLNKCYDEQMWKLLLQLLPNWKLPQPTPPPEEHAGNSLSTEDSAKAELVPKESRDIKNKKEEKTKEDKKTKTSTEKEIKISKEKISHVSSVSKTPLPNVLLFASFSNPPSRPSKVSELKEMADASERLRQFGLSHNLPHPVLINMARDCPLMSPPVPIQVPRWKLIRQKKKKEPIDPPKCPEEPKDYKCLELNSPFFNFKVGSKPLVGANSVSPTKWDKFKPATPMESVSEEGQDGNDEIPIHYADTPDLSILSSAELHPTLPAVTQTVSDDAEVASSKKNRSLSISSQVSVGSASKLPPRPIKSNKDVRKSILKDTKSDESKQLTVEVSADTNMTSDETDTKSVVESEEDDITENEAKEIKKVNLWMDFIDFCQCFRTLWVYHKPKLHTKHSCEMKYVDSKSDRTKKGVNANSGSRSTTLSPVTSNLGGNWLNNPSPPYLLVDCVVNTEVVVSFASFSRWFDPNLSSNITKGEENEKAVIQALTPKPGSLVVEPYYWKHVTIDPPLLRMKTTGIKAVALNLPPGRHVLRLVVNAPLGYHVCITSTHAFVLGDENTIMQHLIKESALFIKHGINVLNQLKRITTSFSDSLARENFVLLLGTEKRSTSIRRDHFEMLVKCLVDLLKNELAENFTPTMYFALAALKYQAYFHLQQFKAERVKRRPASSVVTSTTTRQQSLDGIQRRQRVSMPEIVAFNKHSHAATRIQAVFKGYYIVKLKRAYMLGSAENTLVIELLQKIWSHIETKIESFAVQLYRAMFNAKPNLSKCFPFHADEWNKIVFSDYNASYPEQAADDFFLLFREVFMVEQPLLMLPKFYCNVTSSHLKVINNDTYEETKTVFMKVIPQVMQPNKQGYTVVVTGQSEFNIPAGKCRLRVIGEKEPLPTLVKDNVNCQFVTKEVKNYYIPNKYHRIFRYKVKVTEDIVSSIQFKTSKEDVFVLFQVIDNGVEIYSCEGKGSVLLPAMLFYKDRLITTDETKNTLSSPNSRAGSARSSTKTAPVKRPSSRKSASPDKAKRKSNISVNVKNNDNEDSEEVKEEQIHKYILQAYITRGSWPLTKKEWDFVDVLKTEEEAASEDVSKNEVPMKNSAGKNRKKEGKGNRSRPESQTQQLLDPTKPHWSLRFVVDADAENSVEIKQDTEREDEIKAIKAAWESLEPGRAAKAQQARLKYLESHTYKPVVEDDTSNVEKGEEKHIESEEGEGVGKEVEEEVKKEIKDAKKKEVGGEAKKEIEEGEIHSMASEADSGELFDVPPVKDTDRVLKQIDVFPFIRSTGKKIHLDESEEEKIRVQLQKKFTEFDAMREMVLSMREDDRIARNLEKEKQLAEYEKLQLQLDQRREELYKTRDAYKQKFVKQQEVEVVELEVEKKKRTPTPKGRASKAGKSPTKAKKK